jgi:surfeit locus 1 family protein
MQVKVNWMTEVELPAKKFGWKSLILPLCIVSGFIFLTFLGTWQMKRLAWKEALIARVEQNLHKPPLSIADIQTLIKSGKDIEYRPVTLRGEFHHDQEQYFFATHKSIPGWYVYTPLQREDGSIVIVNRGFVPARGKLPSTRLKGQVDGVVEIVGLARSAPSDKPNSFVPDNDLQKNVYYWKSINQMFAQSGFKMHPDKVMFFVDADDKPNPGNWPVGGVTLIRFSNSHLQYALTWYGLAGALLVVGGIFMFNRRRERG